MNVLYRVTKNLTRPVKVPRILCSSARLKDSSLLLLRLSKSDPLFDAKIEKVKFESLTLQTHGGDVKLQDGEVVSGGMTQKKDDSANLRNRRMQKKKGFEALIRWCSAHQEVAALCSGSNDSYLSTLGSLKDIHMVDIAAISWLQRTMSTLSCGQSLVILSLLCDILYHKARVLSLVSGKKPEKGEKCKTPNDPEGTIEQSLLSTILALKQRIAASEHLESQPLTLFLSAIYGLHRISSCEFPFLSSLSTVERSLMEVPDIFFTIAFRQMREAISSTSSTQPQSSDPALSIEVLLTFMLLFSPERRAEFHTQADQKVFSDVVDLLEQKINLCVKTSEESHAPTGVEQNSDGEGESKRSGKDIECHGEMPPPSKAMRAPSKASALDCAFMNLISLQECAELMRNVCFAKTSCRLSLLQYVCCCLQSPSKFTLEEIQLLLGMFRSLENVGERVQGRWLTDYIIQQLPLLSVPMMIRFLPYTQNPSAYVQRMELTDDHVKSLSPEDALELLQVGSSFIPWDTQKQLILASLDPRPRALIECLLKSKTKPRTDLCSEEALKSVCTLTPGYISLLSFLVFQRLPNMKSDPGEEANREEVFYWTSVLMTSADWCKGVETEQPHDHSREPIIPSANTKENEEDPSKDICHSFKALEIYVAYRDHCNLVEKKLGENSTFPQPMILSDKTLLNHYVRYVFMSTSECKKNDVIAVLVRLLSYLEDRESKRQLVDRLIRYNEAPTSKQSLARFIELLSEAATALAVYNPDLLRLFLKQSCVDPGRLGGAGACELPAEPPSTALYTLYLTRSLRYLLGGGEGRAPARAEEARRAITAWLNHYFLTLAKAREGPCEGAVEELLGLVYRAGCDLPPPMLAEVARRCRERLPEDRTAAVEVERDAPPSSFSSSPEEGEGAIGFVDEPHVPGGSEAGGFLPPAHFLVLVRSEVAVGLRLDRPYLEFLLRSCGLEMTGGVLGSFLIAVQRRRARPALIDDLCIIATTFETVLKRLPVPRDDGDSREPPEKARETTSAVLAQLVRVSLAHLYKTPGYATALAGGSTKAELRGEAPLTADRIRGEGGGEATGAGAVDGKREPSADQRTLKGEILRVDGALLRAFSLLTDESEKEIALQYLHQLQPVFRDASKYLFSRACEQMNNFSQKELILLASRYPAGADEVLKHLMKMDLRLTVDFGEFLKEAKNIPMQIVEKITDAHLESLSFAWCTRLLSALVVRQEEVSDKFLVRMLRRVMEADAPRESDRNLFLFILQSYLPMPNPSREGTHPSYPRSEERGASSKTSLKSFSPDNNNGESNVNEMKSSVVPIAQDKRAREKILYKCLKHILSIYEITTTDGLIDFLSTSLPIAQNLIELAVMERAEKITSEYLLNEVMVDTTKLTKLVHLLHRHHLPILRIGQIVKKSFFDSENFLERIAPSAPSEGGLPDDEAPFQGGPTPAASVAHTVELAALIGGAQGGGPGAQKRGDDEAEHCLLEEVLKTLRGHFQGPSEQLLMLSALVDTMARYDFFPVHQLDRFTRDLCEGVLIQSNRLSSSELAKLLQNISRLKKWDVIKRVGARVGGAGDEATFDKVFRAAYARADPHSRCVVVKAMCSDKELFLRYGDYAMGFLRPDIPLLSHEDLEVLLVACLRLPSAAVVEATLDAVGTRLLGGLDQCKRSTLVRLLQCHASFAIADDALLTRVLARLEGQFVSRGEAQLENSQLLTLLQAIARLDLPVPSRLATLCFAKLEKQLDRLTPHQLAQAGWLAMELEMGYSASIHALVVRILETREGYRSSKFFRDVSERLCDEYDVEVPALLRAAKLRARRERERIEEYWQKRRLLTQN